MLNFTVNFLMTGNVLMSSSSDFEIEESVASEEPEEEEDFREKQVKELEKLQIALDENNTLRAKYNALQIQVAPSVDAEEPPPQPITYHSDKVYTQEEIDAMKQKLEQAVRDYRRETRIAGQLNSEIEKGYKELGTLRMKYRVDQDERLTKQNATCAIGLSSFRAKTEKVREMNDHEKQRILKSIEFLQNLYDSSVADIAEFAQQSRTNGHGIAHLSSSITIAREDVREFSDQLRRIEPRLKEYEELRHAHEQSEELTVQLSDQLETLKKQVETESLTANVKRQINEGRRTIADLNRAIDKLNGENSQVQDQIREIRQRIADLEQKRDKTKLETMELTRVKAKLAAEREKVKRELDVVRVKQEVAGGENTLIRREIESGVSYDKGALEIRKELLALKGEVRQLDRIEANQMRTESVLSSISYSAASVPVRKRVPLIPLHK